MRTPAPGSPLLHRRDWLAAVPLWALGATGCSTLPPEGTPLQISDYGLPFVAATVDGMQVLQGAKKARPDTEVLVMTALIRIIK